MTPDVNAFTQTLIGLLYTATATVNAGGPLFVDTTVDSTLIKAIRQTTPPDPYPQGWPKPFAVLRNPGHSTALADEDMTTSNISGTPNPYRLYVYMTAYKPDATRDTEELLCNDVYSAIASYLRPPTDTASCIPDSNAVIVAVKLVPPTPNGPFVTFGGAVYIGAVIDLLINEWYQ